MPTDLNSFDWDGFFERSKQAMDIVSKESDKFLAAQNKAMPSLTVKNAFTPNNSSDRTVNLQNQFAGNTMTGPNPGDSYMLNMKQQLGNFSDYMRSSSSWAQDKFKLAKPLDYNGSQYGMFFDRYYHHPKFKKLGFSPYRDNESFYNQNSSNWDDFKRMTKVWDNLFWDGATGLFQNWGNTSLAGDMKHAATMEKYMGIAQSTKGGAPAFVTNLAGNSAYTFGILAEIAAEEGALALIGLIPGAQGVTAAGTVRNIGRVGKLAMNIPDMLKGIKSTKQIIASLGNVSQSRKFYQGMKNFGKGTMNFLNPLEHSVDFMKQYNNMKNIEKLSDLALTSKGFGSFYRDLRAINAAWDEATLEGGMVQNEISAKLLNDFYNQHGYLPEPGSEEAEKIYQTASDAGRSTSLFNIPAILYSNKIVFDRALRGTPLNVNTAGDLMRKGITKVVDKESRKVAFQTFDRGIKGITQKAFWREAPKGALKGSLRYLNANLTEGFQELYQEGLSVGMKDYYQSIYQNPQKAGLAQMYASVNMGAQSQLSAQGLEVFASGALMGGLVQGPQWLAFQGLPQLKKQIAATKVFGEKGAQRRDMLMKRKEAQDLFDEQVAASMTAVYNNPNKLFNLIEENSVQQRNLALLINEAQERGDQKLIHDASTEGLAVHLHTLLSAGKLDIFKDQLRSMQSLSPEELEEAIGQDPTGEKGVDVQGRISKVLNQIKQFEAINESFDKKFGTNSFAKDKISYQAFNRAKLHTVYSQFALQDVADRMNEIYNSASNDKILSKGSATDISILLQGVKNMGEELKTMAKQAAMGSLADASPEQRKEARKLNARVEALSAFREDLQNYMQDLTDIEKLSGSPDELGARAEANQSMRQELLNKFTEYFRTIGQENDEVPLDSNIEDLFEKVVDFHRLSEERKSLVDSVNILSNREYFLRLQDQIADAFESIQRNQQNNLRAGLQEYRQMTGKNEVFNKLFEKGIFLTPEGVETLEAGRMPIMYSVPANAGEYGAEVSHEGLREIRPDTDDAFLQSKYQQGMQIINDYEVESGQTLSGKQLYNRVELPTNDQGETIKAQNDQRTLRDLYEELGLDPNKDRQEISVQELIDSLLPSEFVGRDSEQLLKALAVLIGDKEKVTIVKGLNQPTTYVKGSGIQIDLRFFAEDYNGQAPFERTVIRELLKVPASHSYTEDQDFKKSIDDLFQRVTNWYNQKDNEQQREVFSKLGYTGALKPYGLSSPEAFISEALGNARFQGLLANIASDETYDKSTFQVFLDYIKTILSKIINPDIQSSVLDEATAIITDKLFTRAGIAPIEDIQIVSADDIIKAIDEDRVELIPQSLVAQLTAYVKSQDANAYMPAFVKENPDDEQIRAIIDNWTQNQLPKDADLKQAVGFSQARKRRELQRLGYSAEDILAMPEEDKNTYIDNKIPLSRVQDVYYTAETGLQTEFGYTPETIQSMQMGEVINAYRDEQLNKLNTQVDFEMTKPQQEVISKIYENLHSKNLQLRTTDTGTAYFEVGPNNEQVMGPFARVSDLKISSEEDRERLKDIDPVTAARGTFVDDLAREFLKYGSPLTSLNQFTEYGKVQLQNRKLADPQFENLRVSDGFLRELYSALTKIREIAVNNKLVLLTDIPTLSGNIAGLRAGTADIIAVNAKGQVHIIDIKTAESSRVQAYKDDKSFYKVGDRIQLNAYRELLEQSVPGVKVSKIKIFPIRTTSKGGVYESAKLEDKRDAEGNVSNMLDVSTEKDIFELLNIDRTPEVTVEEEPVTPRTKVKPKKITYSDFSISLPGTGVRAVWNSDSKNWGFFSVTGSPVTNPKSIRNNIERLSAVPGIISVWKDYLLDNNDVQQVTNDLREFQRMLGVYGSEEGFIQPSLDLSIMRAIQGIKFSPTIAKDLTDVNLSKWTKKSGVPVDTFVSDELLEQLAETGFPGLDEQNVVNKILEIISQNPQGITKKAVQALEKEQMSNVELQNFVDSFINKYGIDPAIALQKWDISEQPEQEEVLFSTEKERKDYMMRQVLSSYPNYQQISIDGKTNRFAGVTAPAVSEAISKSNPESYQVVDIVNGAPVTWSVYSGEVKSDLTPVNFTIGNQIIGSVKFDSVNKSIIQTLLDAGREPKAVLTEVRKNNQGVVTSISYDIIANNPTSDSRGNILDAINKRVNLAANSSEFQALNNYIRDLWKTDNITIAERDDLLRRLEERKQDNEQGTDMDPNLAADIQDSVVGADITKPVADPDSILDNIDELNNCK